MSFIGRPSQSMSSASETSKRSTSGCGCTVSTRKGNEMLIDLITHLLLDQDQVITTKNDTGVESSLYRGRYYSPADEEYRKCVATRESNGRYWAVSSTENYRGAYQVSAALTVGMGWMIQKELKVMSIPGASDIGALLRSKPMNRWSRYFQDFGFWVTFNHDGPRSGLHHWAGGRYACVTK